jgi:hypothetical protein
VEKQSGLIFIHKPSPNYGQFSIYRTVKVFVMSDITEKVVRKQERREREEEGKISKGNEGRNEKKEKK